MVCSASSISVSEAPEEKASDESVEEKEEDEKAFPEDMEEEEEEEEEEKEAVAEEASEKSAPTLKEELVEILADFAKAMDENAKSIGERLDALENKLGEFEKDENEKLAEKAAGMTTASVASLLAQQMAGEQAKSVIGQSATHVHGNSKLANDGPEENIDGTEKKQEGLFFQKWTSGYQS